MDKILWLLTLARKRAEEGVEYRPGAGARCPLCGAKLKVFTTRKWEDGVRVRYHKCRNHASCLLAATRATVKSLETSHNI